MTEMIQRCCELRLLAH
ncbi:hypothetical protein RDI58_021835 [Solanum bulbocastanum]|uniref:Uncharacterized protein n=1 Tax=Solanum bulbocastanum TaxID=147425 RepID=A0AAN8Y5J0_SOLBU